MLDTDVGLAGLIAQRPVLLHFIPKALDGVEVRALGSPLKFVHTKQWKLFLYGSALCTGHRRVKMEKGHPQNSCHKAERLLDYCLKYNWIPTAFIFPLTGTKMPKRVFKSTLSKHILEGYICLAIQCSLTLNVSACQKTWKQRSKYLSAIIVIKSADKFTGKESISKFKVISASVCWDVVKAKSFSSSCCTHSQG